MDPNPYAPPTATVADVENPASPRRMPLGVRLLQLFCALSLYAAGLALVREQLVT